MNKTFSVLIAFPCKNYNETELAAVNIAGIVINSIMKETNGEENSHLITFHNQSVTIEVEGEQKQKIVPACFVVSLLVSVRSSSFKRFSNDLIKDKIQKGFNCKTYVYVLHID